MKRLEFVGWLILSIVLLAVSLVGLGIGARALHITTSWPTMVVLGAIALVLVIAEAWINCALQAKRIRDIGIPPMLVMVTVTAIIIVDAAVLTQLTEMRFFWPFHQNTPLGGLINAAYLAMLLFWPGTDTRGADAPDELPAPIERPVWPRTDPAQLRPTTGVARTEFGLRTR
jgi:uncharacterized membrane protein YhaH (DUF805 family)